MDDKTKGGNERPLESRKPQFGNQFQLVSSNGQVSSSSTKAKPMPFKYFCFLSLSIALLLSACDSGDDPMDEEEEEETEMAIDIKDAILTVRSGDCSDYVNEYTAAVTDLQRGIDFVEDVAITVTDDACLLTSNNIPNHDFNDATARFANDTGEVAQALSIRRNPSMASLSTELIQGRYDAVFLNGVVLDILSAGCYNPDAANADPSGNVAIGCSSNNPWLTDPLGTGNRFGTDIHNAHSQASGLYHYHGNPKALFDDNPGSEGSPVIGFAADGFPVYGSYFVDDSGTVRKATSGYTLKTGSRPGPDSTDPGGTYDGLYNSDFEFTNAGDLDECNGMTVNGQYGYYVIDAFPWVIRCFAGTPDDSFNKRQGVAIQHEH